MLDLLPHALPGVLFLLSAAPVIPGERRVHVQLAAHSLLSVLYLFAPTWFHQVTIAAGEFKELHAFLHRFVAAFHIGIAYHLHATQHEPRQQQPVVFARCCAAFFTLLSRLVAAWVMSERAQRGILLNDYFVLCALLTDGLWFASEFARFMMNKRAHQEEVDAMCKRTTLWIEGRGSFYVENALYLDAAVSLILAMINFAFPQNVLKCIIKNELVLDSHHLLWSRAFGALCLLPTIGSLLADRFEPKQQLAWIASRLVTQCVVFLLHIWGHWIAQVYSANHITGFMVAGFYMSGLFSLFYRAKRCYDGERSGKRTVTRIETTTTSKNK